MNEHDLKAELFGELKPRTSSGGHQPSHQELTETLEGDSSIMFAFCEGCGVLREITAKGKIIFEAEFGITIPDPPKDVYLHVTHCMFCNNIFRNPEVRQIPQ